MHQEHLKHLLNIEINLPDEFYLDTLISEINIIYYGEKIARILYKRLGNLKLSQIEKNHEMIIKEIIKKPKKLDPTILLFFKKILKSKNDQVYISFLKSLEHYAIFRYKTIIDLITDSSIKYQLDFILQDELKHFIKNDNLEFKSNFNGFENYNLYLKYKDILKINYHQFKQKMWNTDFYKKIRGVN